ncbi:hypothetical protein NST83_25005 [Paenibacillus sp. FSL R10-2782]|uniref:hypothetical protein n=1 Tax=Paenibacillus sp. FSL R10-2782 TaxID=2954661 RepID=UPI003159072C
MPEEVFVNSIWVGLPIGTVVGPGMIIGTNAFGTITEGVAAVAPQGTVQVAAGTYIDHRWVSCYWTEAWTPRLLFLCPLLIGRRFAVIPSPPD